MPHNAAFHRGLHCLPSPNRSSKKNKQECMEIITYDPSMYTMDHPDFIGCSFMENSIGLKRVKNRELEILEHLLCIINLSIPSTTDYCYFSLKRYWGGGGGGLFRSLTALYFYLHFMFQYLN